MKTYIKSSFFLVTLITVFLGCKKSDKYYREFIEDGEIVYIGRADSLELHGGDQRAELQWLLISDPKVSSYKIYWNNRADSMSNTLTKTKNIDTVRVIIDGLEEKIQEFEVFLLDKRGNSSVQTTAIGKVYGPRYQRSLLNRVFRSLNYTEDSQLEIGWSEAVPSMLYSEVQYTDTDGKEVTHRVETDVEQDVLELFPENGTFQLRSAFLPDSTAIDTFYTDFEQFSTASYFADAED